MVSRLDLRSGRSAVEGRAKRNVNSCLGLFRERRSPRLPRNSNAGGMVCSACGADLVDTRAWEQTEDKEAQ